MNDYCIFLFDSLLSYSYIKTSVLCIGIFMYVYLICWISKIGLWCNDMKLQWIQNFNLFFQWQMNVCLFICFLVLIFFSCFPWITFCFYFWIVCSFFSLILLIYWFYLVLIFFSLYLSFCNVIFILSSIEAIKTCTTNSVFSPILYYICIFFYKTKWMNVKYSINCGNIRTN